MSVATDPAAASPLSALLKTRRRWAPLFEALLRNAGMGLFALDADGRFVIYNPECERLTGVPAGEILAPGATRQADFLATAAEAPPDPVERRGAAAESSRVVTAAAFRHPGLPPEGTPPNARQVRMLLRPEGARFDPDAPTGTRRLLMPLADGSRRWVEVLDVPVGAPGSRAELVVGFLRDVHDQKLLETHMARLEKLAALGELTAGIAHEVRNPLAAMKLGLDALHEELPAGSPAQEIAGEVAAELKRLDRVVGRLLDFARVKESELQPTDLPSLVDRTLHYVRNQARGRHIELITRFAPDLRPVNCDPDQIQQVLLNIILNAFHAMPAGGRLTIEVERNAECVLPGAGRGPAAGIRLTDTGVGIPEHVLHKVFDPFFSTRPGGTGLGLSVSFQLVSRHGGDMDITSRVGEGTTLRILLPEAGPGPGARGVPLPPAPGVPSEG